MKIIEYKSHFAAECERCGHTIFIGRSELKEAFEKLVGANIYLEFSLGCRCAGTRSEPAKKKMTELELDEV